MNCYACNKSIYIRGSSVRISKYLNRESLIGTTLHFHWICFVQVAGIENYEALSEKLPYTPYTKKPPSTSTPVIPISTISGLFKCPGCHWQERGVIAGACPACFKHKMELVGP